MMPMCVGLLKLHVKNLRLCCMRMCYMICRQSDDADVRRLSREGTPYSVDSARVVRQYSRAMDAWLPVANLREHVGRFLFFL